MWQPPTMELMPGFWPPRPSRFWNVALQPLRRYYLARYYKIAGVTVEGVERLNVIRPGDGTLLAPNHSHDADPHVMMHVGCETLSRQLYFMAAWQVFLAHRGIDGWVMQRFGAFSVDREGCDRRAIRQATELLTSGQWLVVFPEGEIFHTNERLTPLKDGVAFMGITAQRDLDKSDGRGDKAAAPASENGTPRVWVVPTCIRYRYVDDIRPQLESSVLALEQRLMLRPKPDAPLPQRILALGEVLITIKEKEQLGHAMDQQGDLHARLDRLVRHILSKHETQQLGHTNDADSVPVRVKTLRHHLLERLCDEKSDAAARDALRAPLDELHLVLQLYSYPGDYILENPSVERMAETVEKLEEDLTGTASPKGRRHATVTFGDPIDVRGVAAASPRPRAAATDLTARLDESIRALMSSPTAAVASAKS